MIRRLLLLFLATLIFCPVALSQVTSHTAYRIVFGPTNPATCSPTTGDVFFNTTSNLPEFCSALNTWTTMTGGAFPQTVSGTVNAGGFPYFSSATVMSSSGASSAHSLVQFEGTSSPTFLVAAGYAGVPQEPSCITGSDCTLGPPGVSVDTQSSATPSVALTDRLSLVNLTNNTTSTALSVPLSGATNFDQFFSFAECNSGTVIATATPTTSTVNGNATLKLPAFVAGGNPACAIWYGDNTNYHALVTPLTDANGLVPPAGLQNNGTTPSSTVFYEGDGKWATPTGGVTINAVNLTGQTADTGVVTIITPGANGFYRMEAVVTVTTVGTAGCVTPKVQARFTDADSNQGQGDSLLDITGGDNITSTCTTLGARNVGNVVFYAKSGVAIQYSVSGGTYTGGLVYAARIRLWGPY